jgi:hypothetical protein
MKTQYTKGYLEGVQYARNQMLEFLNAHHDLGDILTFEEIIQEIEHWEINDIETLRGLANGRLALIDGVEERAEVCEDCFGSDLCGVCEGAGR